MKFQIVENHTIYDDIDVEQFREDYPKMTSRELCKKYNTNLKRIYKLRNELGVSRKRGGKPNPKFYSFYKQRGKWFVVKKGKYYASVKTEEEAKRVVDFLKKNNWNRELLQNHKNEILNGDE